MNSSRTPEGLPTNCPLCGQPVAVEFLEPLVDAPCTSCGHPLLRSSYLWPRVRALFAKQVGVAVDTVTVETPFMLEYGDSLDTVELMMTIEEELSVKLTDDETESLRTLGDWLRIASAKPIKDKL